MNRYLCEPNPSGRGGFIASTACPVGKGDHLNHDGVRYEVLQVQHFSFSIKHAGPNVGLTKLIVRRIK